MAAEVRFYYMIPAQVVRRRTMCPVAYLPVGALEWHGSHLPFGTDCMTVEHIAVQAATKAGGVVFPPVAYGDVRYRLQETRPEWRRRFAEEMKLDPKRAATFGYGTEEPAGYRKDAKADVPSLPLSNAEQTRDFIQHLCRVMTEIYLYGFRGIVLLPGHGPTTSPCLEAVKAFRRAARQIKHLKPLPEMGVFHYFIECRDIEPNLKKHWVHADKIESSILLAARRECVHPEKLPRSKGKIPDAYLGGDYLHPDTGYAEDKKDLWESFDAMDPRRMSEAYGRKIIDFSVKRLASRVRQMKSRLNNRKPRA